MTQYFDIWQFLAGLGIFLFGMLYIEEALKNLAGRAFKRFLRRYTRNPVQGILSGTVITAVLQSSSVVTLMVLAFVGAEIITLRNALGVVFGSNLGTTFTGWVVATLGFKLDIESFALPFIAIGGISMVFFSADTKPREIGRFLIGFGFLFLGLDYMKTSIEYLATNVDLSLFADWNPYAFFVVGFVLTAIIQSSSASMVITLSALHAGVIPLEAAAATVIGSDLGTTLTVMLGGLKGLPAKKRVALSHFFFNLITAVVALVLLFPLLYLLRQVLGLSDPLITLVAFHSSFNLMGILLITPFLGVFVRFLEKRFASESNTPAIYINRVTTDVPEAAIEALEHEIRHLIDHVFALNLHILRINPALYPFPEHGKGEPMRFSTGFREKYEVIKQLEGEIVAFYLDMQQHSLDEALAQRTSQCMHAVRNTMMGAKGIKDIDHNLREFEKSINDSQVSLFEWLKGQQNELYFTLYRTFQSEAPVSRFELLVDSARENHKNADQFLKEVYRQARANQLNELEISTLLNVSREVFNANRFLILAVKDVLFNEEQARDFDALPELR